MNSSFSQTNEGKIMGNLIDENKKPVEFANVLLHRALDSVFVKAAISDEKGNFEIDHIAQENYYIAIKHQTFNPFKSEKLSITPENQIVNFTDIKLNHNANNIEEVVVKSSVKPFVERKLDKIIVNVENSIVATGNSVLEVLERSPGVMVNQESSINLKGKSGVVIMIDGKPTPLSGTDLMTYLKGIQASNVQTIEIISNPSAKYDAAGNAGIINIKFKKNQKIGFNGSATLSYGQGVYAKPSASTNLNYRNKKWNFFGSYSHAEPTDFTMFYINRKFFDANHNVVSIFDQTSYIKRPIISDNSKIGADFYANEKTVFGVMLNGNWNSSDRDGNTNSIIKHPDGTLDYTTDNSITLNEKRFNGFGNINFKHTFNNEGKEITADVDFGQYDSKTLQDINNSNLSADGQTLTLNKLFTNQVGNIAVKSIKTDYAHPFSKTAKLDVGIKSSLVTSDNDVKFYDVINDENVLDPNRSNNFIYKENINAVYASFAKEFTKWDFQVGLRTEHTHTNGEQIATNEKFSRDYTNFFPNVVVNRKFSDDNSLSFSYAKRIDRPTYRQLNPFKIFVDSYTYVVGDPTLKSVITNLFELNHTFKGKYITSLTYSKSNDAITDIFQQDDATKISFQIPANMQDFEQINLGIYVPFKIDKTVNSTLSGSVNNNKYTSPLQGGTLHNDFTSWDANLTNNISLGNGWSAELNGFYQSKSVWGLFIIKNLAQVSSGIQKVSKNKNSTFKFSISDIFLTNRIAVEVQYQNQDFFTNRTWDSRVATFSYTYRFGKNTIEKARQHKSGVEDEKRRAG